MKTSSPKVKINMEPLYAYMPIDRQFAIIQGVDLPDPTTGAALFADISGFTKLTDALIQNLGAQRGTEELSRWLNKIYDSLIADISRYHGTVINFSGDGITCWFDDHYLSDQMQGYKENSLNSGVLRALASSLAIQHTMMQFSQVEILASGTISLAIKIAISAGSARRFLVGDPNILIIDVLAGKILDQLATNEYHATKGDIVLDEATAVALGENIIIREWHTDGDIRFALLGKLNVAIEPSPWPQLPVNSLSEDLLRPWLLQPVYERLKSGMGEFLTELRPAIALFLHFGGINYDNDMDAQFKLDIYIQAVQHILDRYEGCMLQLTIGDKGCYLYASFGILTAHEDDAIRAVSAALELRDLHMTFITNVQIGVSQGQMRIGTYGSLTRRTYGALGEDVNLAARLMQNASVGDVLINESIYKMTANFFMWEELEPLNVKGKSQSIIAYRLIAKQPSHSLLHQFTYLPMVGREAELFSIKEKLDLVLQGHGQMIGIDAEAGMGKSRLIAEVVRIALQQNTFSCYGKCESYGINISYLVWQNIWREFFGLDSAWPIAKQITILEQQLTLIDPTLLPRLPLLGAIFNLQIPDNKLTEVFSPKLRKESLESLLIDCIRKRASSRPLLFVLEDIQWIDHLSYDLLRVIGQVMDSLPILIVLAYRPSQLERSQTSTISQLAHFTEIKLRDLYVAEIKQLISIKLNQIYGEDTKISSEMLEKIISRVDGNPFYIEELLNYLHDCGLDPQQPDTLYQIDLPVSLYSLILSRIDQLSEKQKTLLKVASVIGRLFHVDVLQNAYSQFSDQDQTRYDLETLCNLDLLKINMPDPELSYLFKHVLTQEIVYGTLSFEMRAILHDQIGQYIEHIYYDVLDQYVDILAFHYERTENLPKKRIYLTLAGEAAQAAYANTAAISYYQRLLPLLLEDQKVGIMLKMGQVLELVGNWQAASQMNLQAETIASSLNDIKGCAQAQHALGSLSRKRGDYTQAKTWLESACASYQDIKDIAGVTHVQADIGDIYRLQGNYAAAQSCYDECLKFMENIADLHHRQTLRAYVLKGAGTVATWQGDYDMARTLNQESLEIHRELGDVPGVATLLNNLGIIARFQYDLITAHQMNNESLELFRSIGDQWAVGQLLNNQACVASDQGYYVEARLLLDESISIRRQLGDKAGLALSLNTLADVALDEGNYKVARQLLDESLALNREIGDQAALAYLLEDYGCVTALEGNLQQALQLVGFAAALRETIGAPLPPSEQARIDKLIAPVLHSLQETDTAAAWEFGRSLSLEQAITLARPSF